MSAAPKVMPTHSPIRLMHFADVHFGVENYGRFDPATGLNSRLVDFRDALNAAIDVALAAGVEVALFAGDAYKTRDPNQTQQREFAACIGRLTQAGVPVVMLAGNHDIPNTKGRANSIEIFGALAADRMFVLDTPRVIQVTTSKGNILQVASMPYLIKSLVLSREESKDKGVQETTEMIVARYESGINQLAQKCDPDLPTVLMGHFSVSNAKLSANQIGYLTNEPEVSMSTLTQAPFDYVALGHIHRFQDLNRGQQPPVVYSGSVERIDFGERNEEKGFALVDLVKGFTEVKHVQGKTRPFVEIEVDATDAGEEPTEKILLAIAKLDIKDAVVKASYQIKSEQLPHLRENDLRAALQSAFMVVSLHKEITRDGDAVRSKLMTEALDPLQALATYCDTRESLRGRKDEMLLRAEPLLRELEAEETVK
ncbi:MAG: exonuclease SbcCD subunit D [Capsulimonas sp.]|uniref:metallophosphoesterase family protein n=1 Tax=Capsulimonas sp. TaxID=2494211 RepID=UPI003267E261